MGMRLGEAVGDLSREELAELLVLRPDLTEARDLADLARRANYPDSVVSAVSQLSTPGWIAVQLACLTPDPARPAELASLGPADPALVAAGADELRRLLLCDLRDGRVHLHGMVRDRLRRPFGLGPPLRSLLVGLYFADLQAIAQALDVPRGRSKVEVADVIADALLQPGRIASIITVAPPSAVTALVAVDRAGGSIDPAGLDPDDAGWLLLHGLLVGVSWPATLVVPREVGLVVRGGRPLVRPPTPPTPVIPSIAAVEPGADAAAAVHATTSRLGRLLERLRAEPAPLRKDNALGVREIRRLAPELAETEEGVAWLVELAAVAGFLWRNGRSDGLLTTSQGADAWLQDDLAARWLGLVEAWLLTSRPTHLAGRRVDGRIALTPLGDINRADDAMRHRLDVIGVVRHAPGLAIDPAQLAAALTWHRPRLWEFVPAEEVGWFVEELTTIGVLAAGRLTPAFAALLTGNPDAVRAELDLGASSGSARFTVQADGTIVLAGPPDPRVAARLASIADVESRGPATVYRVSEASLRRGLDGGFGEEAVLAFLSEHATHALPQAVTVLVADAARRRDALVVGGCRSYVRIADPSVVEQVLRTRKLAKLSLRRAGSGTLVADVAPKVLLAALRDAGFLPAEEGPPATSPVPVARPGARRAPARRPAGNPIFYYEPRRFLPPADPLDLADRLLAPS